MSSDNASLTTPQDDADRIRLKRLAKLQNNQSSVASTSSPPSASPTSAAGAGDGGSGSAGSSSSSKPPPAPPAPSTHPIPPLATSGPTQPKSKPLPKPTPREVLNAAVASATGSGLSGALSPKASGGGVSKQSSAAPSASTSSPTPTSTSTARTAAGLIKKKPAVTKFDLPAWEHETVGTVLKVTLLSKVAEDSGYEIVWLKDLAVELKAEGTSTEKLSLDLLDRALIARLEMDPQKMTDEDDYMPVLLSLPPKQTVFEYLIGCWKRLNTAKSGVVKKGYTPLDTKTALDGIEKIKDLIISYAGYTLQGPEMFTFPQPSGRALGPAELITPLLSLSALSGPPLSTSTSSSRSPETLSPSDVSPFLNDLARRFDPTDELMSVLGPVVKGLLSHESLRKAVPSETEIERALGIVGWFRGGAASRGAGTGPQTGATAGPGDPGTSQGSGTSSGPGMGIGGGDVTWRGVLSALDELVKVKPIAVMITRMEEWNPENVDAKGLERESLMGPICSLGVFPYDWPGIAASYFNSTTLLSQDDIDSSLASLRGTLKSLQSSLFAIFNSLVRASTESREAVLDYFTRVVALNVKRGGMQVDPNAVGTDSFLANIQAVLLRFAEPFMDVGYTKIDKIDALFFLRSSRINIKDETRIKATREEVQEWEESIKDPAPAPNFISNIFFLTIAMSHYGYLKTVRTYGDVGKQIDEVERHLEFINGDGSWRGGPFHAQTEAGIAQVKNDIAKLRSYQLAFEAGLLDPEMVFRSIGFTTLLSTWLIRRVDPRGLHPSPVADLPLPKDVPMDFRALPEYIVEDIVDYLLFAVQHSPDKFELGGKFELLTFVLTFLTSTWYIKNPFLKAKINDVLFMSIWGYGRERNGILGNMLNSDPMALKHVMPAMMHFYIEVEQTGASSQFYDKFNSRRSISYILKTVWNNPTHREALNIEAKNVDKFVRFINLMINDVTYLMDESLSELSQIHNIQVEMDDKATWESKPAEYRREREGTLRSLERVASSYTTLGRSTVELLKLFTAETKAPFMMPEIVDRLAAMLCYNLQALVGPKCQELRVRNPEKYKFSPRELLGDIVQVFVNLSGEPEFVCAVAGDGRSYSRGLFERAVRIVVKNGIKAESEVAQLRVFVEKVEDERMSLVEEEELGEAPDEFLDPLMFTVMKDPVRLPSSRTIIDRATIKSHLLSDAKDPFNRMPLTIEDVIPEPELKARIEVFLIERRRNKGKTVDEMPPIDETSPIMMEKMDTT